MNPAQKQADRIASEIVHKFDCAADYGFCDQKEPCAKCRRLRELIATAIEEAQRRVWQQAEAYHHRINLHPSGIAALDACPECKEYHRRAEGGE